MTATREPRRVRRARLRAAFHARRAREADSPAARMRAAEQALLSAAAHTRAPVAGVAADVADHARDVLARADLSEASRALYEAQLAAPATTRARLGAALMCLRAALGQLPDISDAERDQLFEHYATELAREARQLRGER